ncbi:reverse transcriptase domain-containing protein [Tanacetum coccineum]
MKFNYDSMDIKLDEEAGYTTNEESVRSKHEVIDPVRVVNTQSFEEELSSEEDLDEWVVHKNKQIRVTEVDLKKSSEAVEDTVNNDSFKSNLPSLEELNPRSFLLPFAINNYNSYAIANVGTSNNVMPKSIYEYLKLANLGGATMSVKMDDMTQQETLGIVKSVLVKINKFEFPCDFVVTEMPENLGEMIILGIPFLETIHAQIDVFQEEILLGLSKIELNLT